MEEVKQIYDKLTEENKDIVNLVAKAMEVAQQKTEKEGE